MGLMHMVTARSAKIGTRTFAVAVLEAMFVMDTEMLMVRCFHNHWIVNIGRFAIAVLEAMFVMDTENIGFTQMF